MEFRVKGETERINLSGKDFVVSAPYKLPKSDIWQVSVKPKKNGMMKYVLTFVTKNRADVFKKMNVNSINIIKTDMINGEELETKYFSSAKDIEDFIDSCNTEKISKEFLVNSDNEEVKKQSEETNKIEDLAKGKGLFNTKSNNKSLIDEGDFGFGDETDSDIDEMLQTWENFFEDKSKLATNRAKSLLVSVSNHYLTKEIINNNIYVKQKLSIQTDSLSLLFTQLDLTKNVLMKAFKEIMAGLGGKPLYDLFSQQQKMVLEINTFIGTTLKDIITDLKDAKIQWDVKIEEEKNNTEDIESEVVGQSMVVRDRVQFLKDLGDAINEAEEFAEYDENYIDKLRTEKEIAVNNTKK